MKVKSNLESEVKKFVRPKMSCTALVAALTLLSEGNLVAGTLELFLRGV